MERQYIKDNAISRERLARLVNRLTDEQLKLVIYKEGWTVAVVLGHLAFWDERRRILLKNYPEKGVSPTQVIPDIANDALLPLLLSIPPRKSAELALATAEALDKEIEAMPDELFNEILALKEPMLLNRAAHRNAHMDEIEAFLKK
jgi:hypothetical protein